MTFTSILFLWGTLGIVAPIAIHLWARPKFKPEPFTMLQFLREGQSESRARRRIRDGIILLWRCGIFILLALLFAQPLWEIHHPVAPTHEVWFMGLDNSLSMTFPCQGHDLLTELQIQAKKQIRSCPQDTVFHLFLAADNQWHRDLNRAQALNLVHQMESVQSIAQLDNFVHDVQRQSKELTQTAQLNVMLGSDFAPDVMVSLASPLNHTPVHRLHVIAVAPNPDVTNAGITQVSTSSVNPDQVIIYATVGNTGNQRATRLLCIDGDSSKAKEVTLLPQTHQVHTLLYPLPQGTTSHHPISLTLAGQDNFQADDTLDFSVTLPKPTDYHVLLIDPVSLDRLFLFQCAIESLAESSRAANWESRCTTIDQITHEDLDWADTLVISGITENAHLPIEQIQQSVVQGKRLVSFMTDWPAAPCLTQIKQIRLWPVTDLTPSSAPGYPESQPIGNPWTYGPAGESLSKYGLAQLPFEETAWGRLRPEALCLWRFQNGHPLVAAQSVGKGVSIWVNTSIDTSKGPLAKSPAMVAWVQFLLTPGQDCKLDAPSPAWRTCESLVASPSLENIEQVTSSLFQEQRSPIAQTDTSSYRIEHHPLWRLVAWVLLGFLLTEPFVAQRMRRP